MICTMQMSQRVEMASNIQPKIIGLNVRRNGSQPSVFVRTFSPITSILWPFRERDPRGGAAEEARLLLVEEMEAKKIL